MVSHEVGEQRQVVGPHSNAVHPKDTGDLSEERSTRRLHPQRPPHGANVIGGDGVDLNQVLFVEAQPFICATLQLFARCRYSWSKTAGAKHGILVMVFFNMRVTRCFGFCSDKVKTGIVNDPVAIKWISVRVALYVVAHTI